jgi:hypothetical protein
VDGRRSTRRQVDVGCWIVEGGTASCFNTFEISETGLSVATYEPLPVGRIVRLEFFTPTSANALSLDAQVIWSRLEPEAAMGMRFMNVDDGLRLLIAEFTALIHQRNLNR